MWGRLLKVPQHLTPRVALVVVVSLFGFLFLAPFAGSTSAGQLRTDASLIGQVTDESAAVLPGVTVTAISPALQVESVTAVTNGNGEYRLTPLPIGLYTVEYTLSGFRTLRREGIRLTVGFTARLDVELSVGQLCPRQSALCPRQSALGRRLWRGNLPRGGGEGRIRGLASTREASHIAYRHYVHVEHALEEQLHQDFVIRNPIHDDLA